MSVVADPTGAAVTLWQAKEHAGAGVAHEPGAMAWCELVTTDPGRVAAFFQVVLGVEVVQAPGAGDTTYTMLEIDGEPMVGVLQMTPKMGAMPPSWMTYFQVATVEAALERVQSLGGQALGPPMEAPGVRFGVARDPQGAVFGVMEPAGSS